ncbi:DUF302 domain-containing protein [Mycolicibacterium sp.]|uniref:DUF302 domain-containing protein n=1 Tax=Mycolicibacterium sp. TaxID=2320850 RepID=UPI003D138170
MKTTEPHYIPFDGVRVRYDSDKPFDEVVAALLADVGDEPGLSDVTAKAPSDWAEYQQRVQSRIGPSEFMLFSLIDHSTWLPKAGIDRKVLRVIIGNPVIALTMLRHDVTAGLFAPVELLVVDRPGDRSAVTYVQPSSLMVVEPNPDLLAAARELDGKLAALVAAVV